MEHHFEANDPSPTGGRERYAACGDEDAAWLDANSVPALHIQQAFSSHGRLPYSALLAPHEVRLVEISPVDSGYR